MNEDRTNYLLNQSNKTEIDFIFCVDATGSMGAMIQGAKEKCVSIAILSRTQFPNSDIKFGAIFYRDPVDSRSDKNEYFPLNGDENLLKNWISTQKPLGGGDYPEDWVGCYQILFKFMELRENSLKLVIHIADAPAHGSYFGGPGHEDQVPLLEELIKQCNHKGIEFRGLSIGQGAIKTYEKIVEIYSIENKGSDLPSATFESFSGGDSGQALESYASSAIGSILPTKFDDIIEPPTEIHRIFAIDVSGSISGSQLYHSTYKKLIDKFYRPDDTILIWDNECKKIEMEELLRINSKLLGFGGTNTSSLAKKCISIVKEQPSHLFLITDGFVEVEEIDLTDKIIFENDIKFNSVSTFVVVSIEGGDLSVACPFDRYCGHQVFQVTGHHSRPLFNEISSTSFEDLKVLNSINEIVTVEDFLIKYPSLERSIESRVIGKSTDLTLRNQILQLRQRLVAIIMKDQTPLIQTLIESFKEKSLELMLNKCSELSSEYIPPTDIIIKTNYLLKIADGGLRHIFKPNEIKSLRISRADNVEFTDINEIPKAKSKVSDVFECPISYEKETDPVILINESENPLLSKMEKKDLDLIIECPLNALYNKEFIDLFISHIDHVISLNTIREANSIGHQFNISPITRKPILGAITLGPSRSHVKSANWTLMKLLTKGKILGNIDLWFSLLWFLIKDNKIPYLTEFEPFIREQLIWRLIHNNSSASLSGLAEFIQYKIPLGCACWFSLNSPFFPKPPPIKFDTLRLHLSHSTYLVELCKLLNYPFPIEFDRLLTLLKSITSLLSFTKKNLLNYKEIFQSLIRKSLYIELPKESKISEFYNKQLFIIPLDDIPNEENIKKVLNFLPKICSKLTIEELYSLTQMVNPQLSASDIIINYNWKPEKLPNIIQEWNHYYTYDPFKLNIKISPNTLRPFSKINDKFWLEILQSFIGQNKKFLSIDSLIGQFICKFDFFPTLNEFLVFLYNKTIIGQKISVCLPNNILSLIESRFIDYKQYFDTLTPKEFSTKFLNSLSLSKRQIIENE